MKLTILCPESYTEYDISEAHRLRAKTDMILNRWNDSGETEILRKAEELSPMTDRIVVAVIVLDEQGINAEWIRMLRRIRKDKSFFRHCLGGVIVDGEGELYTKSVGRDAVFGMNMAGCEFPGRPLVEATGSRENHRVMATLQNCSTEEAYQRSIDDLLMRLVEHRGSIPRRDRPSVLVLHASIRQTSNTMRLWEKVKVHLSDAMDITEMSLRNGEILDCGGCPFTMCMHFSEKGQCYYGGVMVDTVYPAVENCDAIVLLCPNYNDAVSANLSAFINRLTALYRRRPFFDKSLFGLIVSGYSGGDIVAMQLISALNMNKSFRLPPYFAMVETANDPGSIERVPDIEERAKDFAMHMRKYLLD